MFETVKRLYDQGKLPKAGVANAVLKGWITEAQYTEITGDPYSV
jgi:hypothetical protein